MILAGHPLRPLHRLRLEDLQSWINEGHVRPERRGNDLTFTEIDVERVRLILRVRDEMAVNEKALPVVLSLLDQLYELRRRPARDGGGPTHGPEAGAMPRPPCGRVPARAGRTGPPHPYCRHGPRFHRRRAASLFPPHPAEGGRRHRPGAAARGARPGGGRGRAWLAARHVSGGRRCGHDRPCGS